MEVTPDVLAWLLKLDVIGADSKAAMGTRLDPNTAANFENGCYFGEIFERLASAGSMPQLQAPAEQLEWAKPAPGGASDFVYSPSLVILRNWTALMPAFASVGLPIDADTKALIVAGDVDVIERLLTQLFHVAHGRKSKPQSRLAVGDEGSDTGPSESRSARTTRDPPVGSGLTAAATRFTDLENFLPRDYSRVSLNLKKLSSAKTLDESDNLLELLVTAARLKIGIQVKSAVNYLTASPERFDELIRFGLKGSFKPIVKFYQELFNNCKVVLEHLAQRPGDLFFVFATLQSGFRSLSFDVALWSCRLFSRLGLALNKTAMAPALWEWFTRPETGGLSVLVEALARHHDTKVPLFAVLDHFARPQYQAFFSDRLHARLAEPHRYLAFVHELVEPLSSLPDARAAFISSGAFAHVLDFAIAQGGSGRTDAARSTALSLLVELLVVFHAELSERAEAQTIMALLKKRSRDKSLSMQLTALTLLFALLDSLAPIDPERAQGIFKTLCLALFESQESPSVRAYLLANVSIALESHPALLSPSPLLEPFIRQIDSAGAVLEDFDFLLVLCKHEALARADVLRLLEFLGSLAIEDTLYGRVACIPFLILLNRFQRDRPVLAYVTEFAHAVLQFFVSRTPPSILPKGSPSSGSRPQPQRMELEEWKRRKILVLEVLAKLLHLFIAPINEALRPVIAAFLAKNPEEEGLRALIEFCDGGARGPDSEAKAAALASPDKSTAAAASKSKSGLVRSPGQTAAQAQLQADSREAAAAEQRLDEPTGWEGYSIQDVHQMAMDGAIDRGTAETVSAAIAAGALEPDAPRALRARHVPALLQTATPPPEPEEQPRDGRSDDGSGYERGGGGGGGSFAGSSVSGSPVRGRRQRLPPAVKGLTPQLAQTINDDIERARLRRLALDRSKYEAEAARRSKQDNYRATQLPPVDYARERQDFVDKKKAAQWDSVWASCHVTEGEYLDGAEEAALYVLAGTFADATGGGLLFPSLDGKRTLRQADIQRLYRPKGAGTPVLAAKEEAEAALLEERARREAAFERRRNALEAKRAEIEEYKQSKLESAKKVKAKVETKSARDKDAERAKREAAAEERRKVMADIAAAKAKKAKEEQKAAKAAAAKAAAKEEAKARQAEEWRQRNNADYEEKRRAKEEADREAAELKAVQDSEEAEKAAATAAAKAEEAQRKKALVEQYRKDKARAEAEAAERNAEESKVQQESKQRELRETAARRRAENDARIAEIAAKRAAAQAAEAEELEKKKAASAALKARLAADLKRNAAAAAATSSSVRFNGDDGARTKTSKVSPAAAKKSPQAKPAASPARAAASPAAAASSGRKPMTQAQRQPEPEPEDDGYGDGYGDDGYGGRGGGGGGGGYGADPYDDDDDGYDAPPPARQPMQQQQPARQPSPTPPARRDPDPPARQPSGTVAQQQQSQSQSGRQGGAATPPQRREPDSPARQQSGAASPQPARSAAASPAPRREPDPPARQPDPPARQDTPPPAKKAPMSGPAGAARAGVSSQEKAVNEALDKVVAANFRANAVLRATNDAMATVSAVIDQLQSKADSCGDSDLEERLLEILDELNTASDDLDTAATTIMANGATDDAKEQLGDAIASVRSLTAKAMDALAAA